MPMQPIGGPLNFDQGPLGAPLMQAPAAPKKKGGMFGSGLGVGEALVAALNGYLAGRGNPVGLANMQMMNQRRHQMADEAAHQNDRENDFQDWVRKQAYAAANPGPINNDTVNDYNFIAQQLGADEGKNYLRNKANPPQLMNIPGVGIVQVPRMGGQGVPSAPVGQLTPIDEGGPMPPASGGFPQRPF